MRDDVRDRAAFTSARPISLGYNQPLRPRSHQISRTLREKASSSGTPCSRLVVHSNTSPRRSCPCPRTRLNTVQFQLLCCNRHPLFFVVVVVVLTFVARSLRKIVEFDFAFDRALFGKPWWWCAMTKPVRRRAQRRNEKRT